MTRLALDLSAAKGTFQKQSTPPTLLSPARLRRPSSTSRPSAGRRRSARAATGCRSPPTRPSASPLDDVLTDATSYSSDTTYPADTVLYWRVRADDENLTGLTWSATGTFQKQLAAPVPSSSNPTQGDDAAGLVVERRCRARPRTTSRSTSPDGTHRDYSDIRTPAASFIKMTGTGVWHWRVRAEFPKAGSRDDAGPVLGDAVVHAHDRRARSTRKTDSAKDHVLLSWDPRLGVKDYKVQIASSPDFSRDGRDGHDRQPELRADDDAVRLQRRRHALLARRRRRRGPQPGRLDAGAADPHAAAAARLGQRPCAPQAHELGARDRDGRVRAAAEGRAAYASPASASAPSRRRRTRSARSSSR